MLHRWRAGSTVPKLRGFVVWSLVLRFSTPPGGGTAGAAEAAIAVPIYIGTSEVGIFRRATIFLDFFSGIGI